MPEITPGEISGFERIARAGFGFLRPAVKPLAYGAAFLAGGYAVERVGTSIGQAFNPPAQVIPVPRNGQAAVFDTKTGGLVLLGQGPAAQTVTGPERAKESEVKTGLYVAGAVALGLVALVVLRGGK